jgi:hypothetical protein
VPIAARRGGAGRESEIRLTASQSNGYGITDYKCGGSVHRILQITNMIPLHYITLHDYLTRRSDEQPTIKLINM